MRKQLDLVSVEFFFIIYLFIYFSTQCDFVSVMEQSVSDGNFQWHGIKNSVGCNNIHNVYVEQ